MLRYDEILEDYRRSVYSLRKLLLLGTQQQRTQVCAGAGVGVGVVTKFVLRGQRVNCPEGLLHGPMAATDTG
jgi:hypothetical protein